MPSIDGRAGGHGCRRIGATFHGGFQRAVVIRFAVQPFTRVSPRAAAKTTVRGGAFTDTESFSACERASQRLARSAFETPVSAQRGVVARAPAAGFLLRRLPLREKPIPDIPVDTDVRRHGAKGNGYSDNTDAFEAAIVATRFGAILVPAGRYAITRKLVIQRGGVVLRGEGPGRSALVFSESLEQERPRRWSEIKVGLWRRFCYAAGFVLTTPVADVAAPTRRGDTAIVLSAAGAFRAGDHIRLIINNAACLDRCIHGFNAIRMSGVVNGWGRHVEFFDCDNVRQRRHT